MKQKLLSFVVLSLLLLSIVVPVSANSSSFSFNMNHYYVNGKDNGEIHNLTKGKMSISGDVTISSTDNGHLESPNDIMFIVFQDGFWFDTAVGSFTVTPVYNYQDNTTSFSQDLGNVDTGDYYITIEKLPWKGDDGFNLSGTGTLETN